MKTQYVKPGNVKKLELKKMAVANLSISEEKMKVIMGGGTTSEVLTTSAAAEGNTCTSNGTIVFRTL